MNIDLMYNYSENNCINKVIATIDSVTDAVIKGDISVEKPTIILKYDGNIRGNINYLYIPEFNRYYFISDIVNLTGNRYEVMCEVDVLESFKFFILSLNCIIDKQQNDNMVDKYINDGSWIATQKEFTRIIEFANGFNETGEYILICAGG